MVKWLNMVKLFMQFLGLVTS